MDSVPQTSGIYMITCTANGKIYIGSSVNMRKRWQTHRSFLRNNQHTNRHLQNAWNKYGENTFVFEVIEYVMPWYLAQREQYWLNKLKPFNKKGFNLSKDTEAPNRGSHNGKGRVVSQVTRDKLRLINLGKTATVETKMKISASQRGKKMSAEAIAKFVESKSRYWIVTNPDGQSFEIKNLSRFCRENGLNHSLMLAVASGHRNHHHGWKCQRA